MKMLPDGNGKSQHLGGEDRQNSMSLRPAYSTESVPGQPPKPYLKKTNKTKNSTKTAIMKPNSEHNLKSNLKQKCAMHI